MPPRGNPGRVKPRQRENRTRSMFEESEREVLAELYPQICAAKGSLPPTPGEIEVVRACGSDGVELPKLKDRWHFKRRGHAHVRN